MKVAPMVNKFPDRIGSVPRLKDGRRRAARLDKELAKLSDDMFVAAIYQKFDIFNDL